MKMLLAGLALALAAHGPAPARPIDYSGNWRLDPAQSRGLPEYYSQVKSHTLAVTQDAARLNVAVTIDAGEAEPERFDFSYALDGTPVETETRVRTPQGSMNVPTTLLARVDEAGVVHIAITRRFTTERGPFTGESREDWSLSPDGRTLTVHRADDTRRGRMEADMVFVRA